MITMGRFGGPSFERQQRREQSEEKDMNMTTKRKTTTGKLIDVRSGRHQCTQCGMEWVANWKHGRWQWGAKQCPNGCRAGDAASDESPLQSTCSPAEEAIDRKPEASPVAKGIIDDVADHHEAPSSDVPLANDEALAESEEPVTPAMPRRLYTCCPNAGCTAFRDTLSFLHSFGIEPSMQVDEDRHHYFEFTIPTTWSIDERRKFNGSLSDKVHSDRQPCENCGNVMYSAAWWVTCKVCKDRFLLCEECMLTPVSLCRCMKEPGEHGHDYR